MRYKFYREHKYLRFKFDELERMAAKADFRKREDLTKVQEEFEKLILILKAHAQYEDDSLHPLLKRKNSLVYIDIEHDHDGLDESIQTLRNLLNAIGDASTPEGKIEAGDQFHLWYRKFSADNLIHLHEEEIIILPELHRLYTDEELKTVEAVIYKTMTAQDLINMLQELFPQMNPSDWEAFLTDIQDAVPEKFLEVWHGIKSTLPVDEQENFIKKLKIADKK